ncbi:FliM/FliN family flagellar motor switch protein [Thermomonas brevis]|uniref:Flagellar motor switch protein FliN n=1 Tax=Thermomonas brevis TaxID=215691 RepID=A0A7G9QSL8_9GAMM|nr:FliM/FliN family flagellar motor switch protein [Thermomonas brevis]QNN46343.1 FliM/FliN family flagellar motor switch protein [Thermomonas brevis]
MNTTTVHAIEFPEAPTTEPTGSAIVGKDMNLVGHLPVSLSAMIGTVSLTVDQLYALRKGEVLTMNEDLETPVTLKLNGKAVARGELVAVDECFGIRITELS